MFWSWVNWSYSHLSLCEVFMGLSFLMWFRSAWSAWDVQAICIVSAVSDVIFPAVPSTLIFSAALGLTIMKKKFHRFAIQRILRFKFADCQCCGLHALTLSFVYCLPKPWIVSPPKRGQLTFPFWGWTYLSYIAVIPTGFWLGLLQLSCPFFWGPHRCLSHLIDLGTFQSP